MTVEAWTIAARLLQFAAAAVLGGGALFFLSSVRPEAGGRWPSRLVRTAAVLGAAGTLGWLMAQSAAFGEASSDAFDPAKVWSVAVDTGFGRAALVRLTLFLLAAAAAFLRPGSRAWWVLLTVLGAAASASFAWTGHGARDEGLAGLFHLAADVLHLLAASVWIGALAGLTLLVSLARRNPTGGAPRDALTGLVRFSGIGVAVVGVLVASGLVNSWFLVGPDGVARILTSPYGRLLVVKLVLFGFMLALAAANRYRHTPQLERALQAAKVEGAAFRPVIASVLTETALAAAVLLLVSWMGTLAPAMEP